MYPGRIGESCFRGRGLRCLAGEGWRCPRWSLAIERMHALPHCDGDRGGDGRPARPTRAGLQHDILSPIWESFNKRSSGRFGVPVQSSRHHGQRCGRCNNPRHSFDAPCEFEGSGGNRCRDV